MFTVITRTANRPKFFAQCRRSVLAQTVQPFHLVISDHPEDEYPEGDLVLRVRHLPGRGHNLYFNEARKHIPKSHPWVIFLDDDDMFTTPFSLRCIEIAIKSPDNLLLWQVQFPDRLIPGNSIFLPPQPGNISGIGFCYNAENWIDWKSQDFGDYLVISQLYQSLSPIRINQALTCLQSGQGIGQKNDML